MITAGEILKKKRLTLEKNIEDVAHDTKIQKRYIEYLENDDYDKFDSQIFITGFIKIYSSYLGLDEKKMLALYRRSNLNKPVVKKPFIKEYEKSKFPLHKILNPKVLAIAFTSILVLGILGYIGFQIYKFQRPPELTITSPTNEETTNEETILVAGNTDPNTEIYINNTLVETDDNGGFSKTETLIEGDNLITIKALKNNSNIQETVETIKVKYQTSLESENVEEDITETNTITLEVKNSAAWIRLDIDKENKISQTIQPGTTRDFNIISEMYITTGRISSTYIYFNGEPITLESNSNNGVAELTCEILENSLVCN